MRIVFAHANSFPAACYVQLFDALKRRGLAQIDAKPMLGHDPHYPVTNNWPRLAEELQAYIDHVRAVHPQEELTLVGHSMGGYLSLMCAALDPAQVAGVIMLDSPILSGWQAMAFRVSKKTHYIRKIPPASVARKRRTHWASADEALQRFSGKRVFARWSREALAAYVEHGTHDENGRRVLTFDRNVEAAIYSTVPDNMVEFLRAHPLHVPVAFVGGRTSTEIRFAGLSATRRLTHGQTAWIEGSHLFPFERPEETAEAISSAVERFASALAAKAA